jgi:hypothetical protein
MSMCTAYHVFLLRINMPVNTQIHPNGICVSVERCGQYLSTAGYEASRRNERCSHPKMPQNSGLLDPGTTDNRNNSTAPGCVLPARKQYPTSPALQRESSTIIPTARRIKIFERLIRFLCYQVVSLLSRDQVTKE